MAALFAVHPMHVESVVWVAERKDVLSTFFGLLTLLAYVRYAKNPDVYRYIPVFVLLALGLLAKPMLVTFPCVCLLLDYWPLGRLTAFGRSRSAASAGAGRASASSAAQGEAKSTASRGGHGAAGQACRATAAGPNKSSRLVVEKIPLFALSVISAAITPYAQTHGGSMASTGGAVLRLSHREFVAVVSDVHQPDVLAGQDVGALPPGRGPCQPRTIRPSRPSGSVLITGLVIWAASMGGATWRWAGSGTSAPWCR